MNRIKNASISYITHIFQALASMLLVLSILLVATQNLGLLSFDSSLMQVLFPICPADLKQEDCGLREMIPRLPLVSSVM